LAHETLILKGITFWGYHGCAPEEAVLGQKFSVDLELTYDMSESIETDRLGDFGYVEAYQIAERVVTKERYNLIQTVAHRIAEEIFKVNPACRATVTVIKPGAPAGGVMDYAAARVTRDGPAFQE
jgi:dihydroneopterin aldolase